MCVYLCVYKRTLRFNSEATKSVRKPRKLESRNGSSLRENETRAPLQNIFPRLISSHDAHVRSSAACTAELEEPEESNRSRFIGDRPYKRVASGGQDKKEGKEKKEKKKRTKKEMKMKGPTTSRVYIIFLTLIERIRYLRYPMKI